MTAVTRRGLLGGAIGAAGAAALAGCASSKGSRSGEPMQFWQFYDPAPQQNGDLKLQSAWFQETIDTWNRANREQIVPVYVPDYTDPANTRLATSFAAGDGPDIFLISPGDFLRYYNGGALLDLEPYMSAEAIDDFYPDVLATRRVGKHVYGLPMENEPLALLYSEKAFTKAHLSEADLPKTWDQMLDVARKLTTGTQSGLVFEVGPGYYQNFTFYPWVWQGHGDIVDVDTQKMAMDTKPVIAALELFGRSISSGVAPRTPPAGDDLPTAFTQGYAAMWQNGIWNIIAMKENAPKTPWGAIPLPTPPGGVAKTALGGWAWVVNKRGRNPEAAARYVVETIGSMSEASVSRVAKWCWGAKSDMSPRKSPEKLMAAAGAFEDPHMKVFHEQILPTGRGEPRYPPVVYKTVSNAIQAVQLGGANATVQAQAAEKLLQAYKATYTGGTML